jgi:hypothetical protein
LSPAVKTVPSIVSRSAAVAAPESSAQSAMSPAPTRMGSAEALALGSPGLEDGVPADALAEGVADTVGAGVGALLLFGAVQVTMIATGLARGERPLVSDWVGLLLAASGLAWLTLPGASAGTNDLTTAFANCGGPGSVWFPDLRRGQATVSVGVMVKF